jgi:lipopolysaccharide transport protein LptA
MKHLNIKALFIIGSIIGSVNAAPTTNTASATPSKTNSNATKPDITALQIRSTNIEAEKNNTTKYSGNVQISQGTLIITADTAIMQNKQKTITISGKPAKFVDLVSVKEQIQASATTMNFDSKSNKIILKGNASIIKDGKTQKDKQQITYDLTTHNYKF